jgi:hypothetical protein
MNFQEKINQDLKEAMKAKDEKALRGIRAIKGPLSCWPTPMVPVRNSQKSARSPSCRNWSNSVVNP